MTEIRLQTYWADADPAGIIYFANYFRLVDLAEEELYLRANTRRQRVIDECRVWLPRVEAHVTYVSPIPNGRAVRVRIEPHFQGEKTVRFDFEILDDETGSESAHGYMTVVCVDRASFKATRIPDEIRRVLTDSA
jgi:YbgC/YbaW family acyl-CoA thioester hydrolase